MVHALRGPGVKYIPRSIRRGEIVKESQVCSLAVGEKMTAHSHEHSHSHDVLDTPGSFLGRDLPLSNRNWDERAFTVGIGGPVGSGKTALMLALCRKLRDTVSLAVCFII